MSAPLPLFLHARNEKYSAECPFSNLFIHACHQFAGNATLPPLVPFSMILGAMYPLSFTLDPSLPHLDVGEKSVKIFSPFLLAR